MECQLCRRSHSQAKNSVVSFGDLRIRLCAECASDPWKQDEIGKRARKEVRT